MRFAFFLVAGSLAFITGCNQDMPVRNAEANAGADQTMQTRSTGTPVVVPFNDMQSFDKELAKSLTDRPEKITVTVDDRIPLKDMPGRVDKWLAAVDNGGGKVTVKSETPEPRTRAIPLIGIAISAFQLYKDHAKDSQYDAAKAYDATVYYKRDANGDRLVERIEMLRRAPE